MIPEINDILAVIHFIGYVGLSSVPMHKAWLVSIMEVLDPGDDIVSFPFPLFSFLLFNFLPGWRGRGRARTLMYIRSTFLDSPLRRLFHTTGGTPAVTVNL